MERGPEKKPLTIGQVARSAGVGVETVRFYERRGLLREPPRRPSGYRSYPKEAIDGLRFIRKAKDLGFSLNEIRDLLALRLRPGTSCSEVKRAASAKVIDVEDKIRGLKKIRRVLLTLVDACPETGPLTACPILNALAGENETNDAIRRKRVRKIGREEPSAPRSLSPNPGPIGGNPCASG
jgi:MerR family copper efflux transcriptional regulator